MFIDSNQLRINIYAPYEYDGVKYANLTNPEVREMVGVTEIPDPQPPEDFSPETYFVAEQDSAPYTIWIKKPIEMLNEIHNNKIKDQIVNLEQSQHRAIREATLTGDKTRLQAIDDEIASLRALLL